MEGNLNQDLSGLNENPNPALAPREEGVSGAGSGFGTGSSSDGDGGSRGAGKSCGKCKCKGPFIVVIVILVLAVGVLGWMLIGGRAEAPGVGDGSGSGDSGESVAMFPMKVGEEYFEGLRSIWEDGIVSHEDAEKLREVRTIFPEYMIIDSLIWLNNGVRAGGYESGKAYLESFIGDGRNFLEGGCGLGFFMGALDGPNTAFDGDVGVYSTWSSRTIDGLTASIFGVERSEAREMIAKNFGTDFVYRDGQYEYRGGCGLDSMPISILSSITKTSATTTVLEYVYATPRSEESLVDDWTVTGTRVRVNLGPNGKTNIQIKSIEVVEVE